MHKPSRLALLTLLLLAWSMPTQTQAKIDVVERGKKATALVEVTTPSGEGSGSGFCIDKAGLFITNAHVVEDAVRVRLVLDIGLKSQRGLRAKVLRVDDELDLALLKVDSDLGLTPLEPGKDDTLALTDFVTTFGFPFGHGAAIADGVAPDITVIRSRVTSLKMVNAKLRFVQFDGQLNPGNSGGPVLDDEGRVVGVAVATVRGAAMNLAIPVRILSAFLTVPGLVFDPPTLAYKDRSQPVTWTIKVQPSTPTSKLPEGLSVVVKLATGPDDLRTVMAQPVGDGVFKVKVTPVPRDPDRKVELVVRLSGGEAYRFEVKDGDVKVGGTRYMLSDLREVRGEPSPRATTSRGELVFGAIQGLGKVKAKVGKRFSTIDLNNAAQIDVRPLDPPQAVQAVEALVEARQGAKVLVTVHKRANLSGAPVVVVPVVPRGATNRASIVQVNMAQGPTNGEELLEIGGVLDVKEGAARGSARAIHPPKLLIGAARLGAASADDGEVRRFAGHSGGIWGVAVSPDSRRVLTASHDFTVRLWDVETGATLRVFTGHTDHVKGVAFLPDGRRGLSAADDDTLRMWDLENGRELLVFRGHTADLSSVAVSADGTRALTGSFDRTARLWDLTSGRELQTFVGHTDIIDAVTFLPDSRRVLTASADGTVRLWDLASGRELRQFDAKAGQVYCIAVSPDGRSVLAGVKDGSVHIWDVNTGKEVGRLAKHIDLTHGVAFTPDGRRAVSSGWEKDQTVRFWDVPGGHEVACLKGQGYMASVAVSPNGRFAALGGTDTVLRLWNLKERAALDADPSVPADPGVPLVRKLPGTIGDVAVGGGGRYLLLTLRDLKKLAVFDVNAAAITRYIPLPAADALVAAGAEKLIVAFPEQNLIQRWDLETLVKETTGPSPIHGRLTAIAMGSDSAGPILAAWTVEGNNNAFGGLRFSFVDPETLKVLTMKSILNSWMNQALNQQPAAGSLALNQFSMPNARTQVRASANGRLFGLWRLDVSPAGCQTIAVAGKTVRTAYEHSDVGHLAPGPDGKVLYSGSSGVIGPDAKPIGPAPANGQAIESLVPTPDPVYFLGINGLPRYNSNPAVPITLTVHFSQDAATHLTIGDLAEMNDLAKDPGALRQGLSPDERFHLVPAANLLITIPPSNDQLVLRRLDLVEALDKQGGDYLFVTSPTSLKANAGEVFRHRVTVKSKKGGITYALTSGPDGMKLSADGELTWKVPADEADEEAVVIITIGDASGQELFHTLKLRVR